MCFVSNINCDIKCMQTPLLIIFCYTPEMKLRTYYGMAFVHLSVRLSICPSVRLSVSQIMSAQYLEKCMSDSHSTW